MIKPTRISSLAALLLTGVLLAGCAGPDVMRSSSGNLPDDRSEDTLAVPAPEILDHTITGAVYESQGDYLRALHEYKRGLLRDSSQVELYHAAAEMHQKLGELESAEMVLRQGADRIDDLSLLEHLGEMQLRLREFDKAATTFQRVLNQDPTSNYALHNLAQAYERSGNADSALVVYDRLLERGESNPEPILMRKVSILTARGDHEAALEIYQQLQEMKPGEDRLPYLISGVYLDMGDTLKAANAVAAATWMRPVEPRYWDMRLRLQAILGNDEKAVELADSALSYNPGSVDLHALAASIYLRQDLDNKAASALRTAIDLDPTDATHYINLGFLLHEQQRWDEAEELYESALKLSPGDPQVLNNYAYLLVERGERLEEALEMSEDAVSLEPDNASYVDTKGWILFKLDRLDEAQRYLERAHRLSPEHYEILDHLGDLYMAQGKADKAREMWRQAMDAGADPTAISRKLDE